MCNCLFVFTGIRRSEAKVCLVYHVGWALLQGAQLRSFYKIQTIHTGIGENKFLQIPDITFIVMNGNHKDGEVFKLRL